MIGIGAKIEELRAIFENGLWTTANYSSYGRAFHNERAGEKVPAIDLGNKLDYKEVLLDDRIDASSFFLVENDHEHLGDSYSDYRAKVGIYFSVDIERIYPSVTDRGDAIDLVHKDIVALMVNTDFEPPEITSGLEAFEKFGMVKPEDNMQPFYLVRFDTSVDYKLNNC